MGGSLVCTPKPCDGNPTGAEGGDNYDPNVQDCTGKFDGSGCDASCYPGYMPSGEAHYTCANAGGRKGRWSDGSLKCTPVTCKNALLLKIIQKTNKMLKQSERNLKTNLKNNLKKKVLGVEK